MPNLISKILGTGAKETVDAIGNAIDKIDRSEEKLELQLKYKQLLMDIESSYISYENKLLDNRSQIILSEAKGESWVQRNWRPMLMLICIFIILNNYVLVPYFKLPMLLLDDNIWNLMEMGVTGYVAGRSLEKITDRLNPMLFVRGRKRKR